jgi:hypothetical protein
MQLLYYKPLRDFNILINRGQYITFNGFNYGNVSKKEQNVNTYTLMCTLNQQEIHHVDNTSSY